MLFGFDLVWIIFWHWHHLAPISELLGVSVGKSPRSGQPFQRAMERGITKSLRISRACRAAQFEDPTPLIPEPDLHAFCMFQNGWARFWEFRSTVALGSCMLCAVLDNVRGVVHLIGDIISGAKKIY